MGPLDMKGLMGAATVIGYLKYGAGLCGLSSQQRTFAMHLREPSILAGPDDCSFLSSLRHSLVNARGVYPPVAMAEIYWEDHRPDARIRRLHLIVVDLHHAKHLSRRVLRQFDDLDMSVPCGDCFNTLPLPITEPTTQGRCRFVYGFGADGSDLPCYLLWPFRTAEGRFWLVDSMTGRYFDPEAAAYLGPIGLEHFFDAFSLTVKRDFRGAAAIALGIPLHEIQPNLTVKQSIAERFHLTPIRAPEVPPAKRVKRSKEDGNFDQDVAMGSEDVKVEPDSSAAPENSSSASDSDMSSEDGSSEESDLDKFEEAFEEFGKLSRGLEHVDAGRGSVGTTSEDVPGISLDGGFDTLQALANVPKTWPLARLTFPLRGFSKQLERLLEGYCLEVIATNAYPDQHLVAVKQFAKDLVLLLALHLGEDFLAAPQGLGASHQGFVRPGD